MTALETLARFETKWPAAFLPQEEVGADWVSGSADLIEAYMTLYRLHDSAFGVVNSVNRADLLHMYANAMSDVRDALEDRRNDAINLAQVAFDPATEAAQQAAFDAGNDLVADSTITVERALLAARYNLESGR